MKRPKELIINICLMLGALLFFFICLEILLRILETREESILKDLGRKPVIFVKSSNPILYYEMKPNATLILHNINISINSQGMRDEEYSKKKEKGVFRVAVIGDSVTASIDLNASDTFPKKLENLLKENGRFAKAEVLNFGVNGYGTRQEMELLKYKVLSYDPDLVILAYVLNDPEYINVPLKKSLDKLSNEKMRVCYIDAIGARVPCVFRQVMDSLLVTEFIWRKIPKHNSYEGTDYYTSLYNSENWANLNTHFTELKKISEGDNFEVILVIFPLISNMEQYPWEAIHDGVKQAGHNQGFVVIDLLDEYRNVGSDFLEVTEGDIVHPNELGQKIAAEEIFKEIMNNSQFITS